MNFICDLERTLESQFQFLLQVYTSSGHGTTAEIILDKENITCPTKVHVNKDGNRLIVISKRGTRIGNYKLYAVSYSEIIL